MVCKEAVHCAVQRGLCICAVQRGLCICAVQRGCADATAQKRLAEGQSDGTETVALHVHCALGLCIRVVEYLGSAWAATSVPSGLM